MIENAHELRGAGYTHRKNVLGKLRKTGQRSFDRNRQPDVLGDGVVALVRHPDVATGIERDGVGLEQPGVGAQACCR